MEQAGVVYVIGLQQMGGCWLWREDFYYDYAQAEVEHRRLVERGDKGVRIFHLYLKKEDKDGL